MTFATYNGVIVTFLVVVNLSMGGINTLELLTNETMFYGGMAVAAFSLISAIICGFILMINKMRLNAKFDYEYGENTKSGKRR